MYFKNTYLARELSIRTEDDGQLKDYEHSELTFRLGGPRDVAVKVQNTENHDHLRCEASSRLEPKPKISNALEALREERLPDSEKSLEEAGREMEQKMADGYISSYSFPWDVLPNYLKDFCNKVNGELHAVIKRTVNVLRWRGAIQGPLEPLSNSLPRRVLFRR
jgi:hypothetical protein